MIHIVHNLIVLLRFSAGAFFKGNTMTTKLDKVLYTAHAHTTGGRDGQSKTDDGRLSVTLSSPGGNIEVTITLKG